MIIQKPDFPRTTTQPFIRTSDATPTYNCIAWAAGDTTKWYEPDPYGLFYWPAQVPRQVTINAFIKLYEYLGFQKCSNGVFEEGFVKVAVFAKNGKPTHAARQLDKNWWTSKIGKDIDVSHSIFSIEEGSYGNVVQFLRRKQ